jgi:hypothetical protein
MLSGRERGRAVLLLGSLCVLLAVPPVAAADIAAADVLGIKLRATYPEVVALLGKLGADPPLESVTCPSDVTGVCMRDLSVTIASAQRRELLAIQFIEDGDHKVREVYDVRYRDLPLQRETAEDFLSHALSKFGAAALKLTSGVFYWGAVLDKGSGQDHIDTAKPYVLVDTVQRIVQVSDPSFFADKRAELAQAAQAAARKSSEQTIAPRF